MSTPKPGTRGVSARTWISPSGVSAETRIGPEEWVNYPGSFAEYVIDALSRDDGDHLHPVDCSCLWCQKRGLTP